MGLRCPLVARYCVLVLPPDRKPLSLFICCLLIPAGGAGICLTIQMLCFTTWASLLWQSGTPSAHLPFLGLSFPPSIQGCPVWTS